MSQEKVGQIVEFVDKNGVHHNALIICQWRTTLNLVYVDKTGEDSYGYNRRLETSVPYFEEGMDGFYVIDNRPAEAG